MSAARFALAACLSAALAAGAIACSGNAISDAISGCGSPGENQGIGVSEKCIREKHFAGCELQLPHPPGDDDPRKVFTLDNEGDGEYGITVSYLRARGSTEPTMNLFLSREVGSSEERPPWQQWGFIYGDPAAELTIAGRDVLIEGDQGTRSAVWKSDCASYQLAASGDATSDELDDLLTTWLRATLE